jgi:hypothetical protein
LFKTLATWAYRPECSPNPCTKLTTFKGCDQLDSQTLPKNLMSSLLLNSKLVWLIADLPIFLCGVG